MLGSLGRPEKIAQMHYLTAAFYKFVDLPDYVALKEPLLAVCQQYGVKGMILLATEGINSTIAGPPEGVHAVLAYLRQDPRLAGAVTDAAALVADDHDRREGETPAALDHLRDAIDGNEPIHEFGLAPIPIAAIVSTALTRHFRPPAMDQNDRPPSRAPSARAFTRPWY